MEYLLSFIYVVIDVGCILIYLSSFAARRFAGAKYWTKAWNPVIGCRKISEGCQNCYAEAITKRFKSLRNGNEDFSPHLVDETQNSPRDGIVFVGNMTDIFGDWNTNEQVCSWINRLNPAAINLIASSYSSCGERSALSRI